jgi:chromosome segregation ATPase
LSAAPSRLPSAEQQEQELTEQINGLREQMHDDFAERKELEEVVAEIERTFKEQKHTADSKERALRSVCAEREEVSEKLHQAELHISELTMQRDNLSKHIHETYELDLAQQNLRRVSLTRQRRKSVWRAAQPAEEHGAGQHAGVVGI